MSLIDYMETDRLNAFYDAIIAIIITVLVLELPQPLSPTLDAIWSLRLSYFAYLISFLVCVNMWNYHHKIFRHVKRVDSRTVWINIWLLLILSIIPYLTLFVADNFSNLLPQVLYGLDYALVNLTLFLMSYKLLKLNPESEYLKHALNIKNNLVIPMILYIISFIIGILGYPQAISIICLFTVVATLISDIK